MRSTRLLLGIAMVVFTITAGASASTAAVEAASDAGSTSTHQLATAGHGPAAMSSPCYIDGDADADCLCDDGSPAPCDEPEEPPYY